MRLEYAEHESLIGRANFDTDRATAKLHHGLRQTIVLKNVESSVIVQRRSSSDSNCLGSRENSDYIAR
jgi:hypothetical protein